MNYKFINLPGWENVVQLTLDHVKNNTDLLERKIFWNLLNTDRDQVIFDAVEKLISPHNLTIVRVMLLLVDKDWIPVHQDNNKSPVARINIPILNCAGSYTNFYTSPNWDPIETKLDNGFPYIVHKDENCVLKERIESVTPVVLNVQSIHNVTTNNPNRPRLMLSIQTDPDAVILLKE